MTQQRFILITRVRGGLDELTTDGDGYPVVITEDQIARVKKTGLFRFIAVPDVFDGVAVPFSGDVAYRAIEAKADRAAAAKAAGTTTPATTDSADEDVLPYVESSAPIPVAATA